MSEGFSIVFMGTPDFGIPAFRKLIEAGFSIKAVVTAPDKPTGRGRKLKPCAMKQEAQKHELPVLQPENLKDEAFLEDLKAYEPDLQIVVAFRKLPKSVWNLPTKGTINLHASLLPDYRGAAPINWAIINGETKTGVTTFYINDQIDTGFIIYQESVEINENELAGELHDKLSEIGGNLVLKTAAVIQKGQPPLKEQAQISNPKKAPKINKADCRIDWHDIVDNVHNLIRGLSPFPGAWTTWQGTNIKIFRTEKENNQVMEQPGTLLPTKSELKVTAKDGCVKILELQPEGSRKMDSGSFLNGFSIPAGSRFE